MLPVVCIHAVDVKIGLVEEQVCSLFIPVRGVKEHQGIHHSATIAQSTAEHESASRVVISERESITGNLHRKQVRKRDLYFWWLMVNKVDYFFFHMAWKVNLFFAKKTGEEINFKKDQGETWVIQAKRKHSVDKTLLWMGYRTANETRKCASEGKTLMANTPQNLIN